MSVVAVVPTPVVDLGLVAGQAAAAHDGGGSARAVLRQLVVTEGSADDAGVRFAARYSRPALAPIV